MCTAVAITSIQGDTYFGRTMDFSYPLSPGLYVIPKGTQWSNLLNSHTINSQYSMIGIGQDLSPVVFADGVNEMGFAAAALYFPGYAWYDPISSVDSLKPSISAIELVPFLLSQCADIPQAASLLQKIRIVGIEDPVTNSVAPLHWLIADRSGKSMCIEKMENSLNLIYNPIGVLTNSPDFSWHLTNLRNYLNITPSQRQEAEWGSVRLHPFGQGAGAIGLPGDYTPPARFVRTAFQKSHMIVPADEREAVTACFHLMEGVSIPKGVVITERNSPDYTQYTAFMNLSTGTYYFKTYNNSQIFTARMPGLQASSSNILSLGLINRPVHFDTTALPVTILNVKN